MLLLLLLLPPTTRYVNVGHVVSVGCALLGLGGLERSKSMTFETSTEGGFRWLQHGRVFLDRLELESITGPAKTDRLSESCLAP